MSSVQFGFRVPDMTCARCVEIISQAIEAAIQGVHVEADMAGHIVTVTGMD